MNKPRVMSFYLEPALKESAEAGQHNFLELIASVGRAAGMEIEHYEDAAAVHSDPMREFAVVHMAPPPHENAVTVRRAYYYPFWSIEQTSKRWDFEAAKAAFDAAEVPHEEAKRFAARWRRKWFAGWSAEQSGHVYIPLQGRLLEQRTFQSCAPIEMLEAVLTVETQRPIIAGLHPKESYSEEEMKALEELQGRYPSLSVQMGGMEQLLPGCDYVVTENSGVGLAGFFWSKPLVLFGQIDFHHIATKAWERGAQDAIRAAPNMRADYDAYLWWFLQKMAINAGRPEAKEKIAARLRGFGWPV
jgi:hypothetical protein